MFPFHIDEARDGIRALVGVDFDVVVAAKQDQVVEMMTLFVCLIRVVARAICLSGFDMTHLPDDCAIPYQLRWALRKAQRLPDKANRRLSVGTLG